MNNKIAKRIAKALEEIALQLEIQNGLTIIITSKDQLDVVTKMLEKCDPSPQE